MKITARNALAIFLWLAMAFASFANTAFAQTVMQPPTGSPLRSEVLNAARPTFESETGGAIEFVVRRLNVAGDWAFGDVRLQRPGGGQIDWRKTKYAADFAGGMFDPSGSFFLVRRSDGVWTVVEFATGPTDIAWDSWRTDYKLPAALFER